MKNSTRMTFLFLALTLPLAGNAEEIDCKDLSKNINLSVYELNENEINEIVGNELYSGYSREQFLNLTPKMIQSIKQTVISTPGYMRLTLDQVNRLQTENEKLNKIPKASQAAELIKQEELKKKEVKSKIDEFKKLKQKIANPQTSPAELAAAKAQMNTQFQDKSVKTLFFGNENDKPIWQNLVPRRTVGHDVILTCGDEDALVREKYCDQFKDKLVAPFAKKAAEFVDLKGGADLLAIGMMGEGFAVKDEAWFMQHYGIGGHKNEKMFDEKIIQEQKGKLPDGTAATKKQYDTLSYVYYGNSWGDDGSDTFSLEYDCLSDRGLIPDEFKMEAYKDFQAKINIGYNGKLPHFISHSSNLVNEDATRFVSTLYQDVKGRSIDKCNPTDVNHVKMLGESNTKRQAGDPGAVHYKTPEAQVFANAALWKLAQDRMFAFKKELGIERTLDPQEIAFWSKVFYNGGQGRQSASYKLMSEYKDLLMKYNKDSKSNYLHKYPGFGSKEVYVNGRITADTYRKLALGPDGKPTSKLCSDKFPPHPDPKKEYKKSATATRSGIIINDTDNTAKPKDPKPGVSQQ